MTSLSKPRLGRALFASLALHAALLAVVFVQRGAWDDFGLGHRAHGVTLDAVLKRLSSRPTYKQRLARTAAEPGKRQAEAQAQAPEAATEIAQAAAPEGAEIAAPDPQGQEQDGVAPPTRVARADPKPAEDGVPRMQLQLPKAAEERVRAAEEPARAAETAQTEPAAAEIEHADLPRAGLELAQRRAPEEQAPTPTAQAPVTPMETIDAMIRLAAQARAQAEARVQEEARRQVLEEQKQAEEQARLFRMMADIKTAEPRQDLLAVPAMSAADEAAARAEADTVDRRAAADQAAARARKAEVAEQAELAQGRRGRISRGYTTDMALLDYGAGWRLKIERIGAIAFPRLLKDRSNETLLVTVTINSDGSLADIRIDRSSGYQDLDEAVRRIVESGMPFSEFPAPLKRRFDIVEITREWSFKEERPRLDMDRID